MKVTKYQNNDERSILIGMIVSDQILSKLHPKLSSQTNPFRSKAANVVSGWCLKFFAKYNKAPRRTIVSLFDRFARKSKDEETVDLIGKYLSHLNDDYVAVEKELNVDFIVDMASQYFTKVEMERLSADLEDSLLEDDLEAAQKRVHSFTPFNLDTSSMVDVFEDESLVIETLTDEGSETLIRFPGALGEFFGPHLQRDGFISFLAPEKRGKSFWLIDVAWRAVMSRRKTLFYSVGDMSQKQMMRRFIRRAARRPLGHGKVVKPKVIRRSGKEVTIRSRSSTFESPISLKAAKLAMKKIKSKSAMRDPLLKMRCTSNSSTKVLDIRSDIDDLVRQGWIPDVVVIDYADILAPEVNMGAADYRHQINETWKALRRLSQDYHVLVVTATQSDALSYDADILTKKNFSDDKRKLAHVTGMVGINQTASEKDRGLFRLNWILLREGDYSERRCVTVAGCLPISNPAMASVW